MDFSYGEVMKIMTNGLVRRRSPQKGKYLAMSRSHADKASLRAA